MAENINMKKNTIYLLLIVLVWFQLNVETKASETGEGVYQQTCASCHSISDNSNMTLLERLNEKAPTLYYAGNKFNHKWLENWLQSPKKLRPGGYFFLNNVKVTDEGDVIDESQLKPHINVNLEQAKLLTEFLMLQKPKTELAALEDVTFKKVNRTLGEKDFHKFKGCGSCHQDEDGYGGVSGPELYTATSRLQAEFISSYIRNPEKWDPKTLMPNRHLNDVSINKLLNYLNVISEQVE